MDPYAFIPACLTTALYWVWWYPAEQPCLPALVLKVPDTNLDLILPGIKQLSKDDIAPPLKPCQQ